MSNQIVLSDAAIEEELLLESDDDSSDTDSSSDSDAVFEDEDDLDVTCDTSTNQISNVFTWGDMNNYSGKRETFMSEYGPQNEARFTVNILSLFKLFFDAELISMIACETNRYAEQFMVNRGMLFPFRSRVREWQPVSIDEIYVVIAMFMLMGIVQKPTIRSYFSRNSIVSTPIFSSVMSLDRFESICRFLHFVDNNKRSSFEGPKKLFKIYPVLQHLNDKFKKYYLPGQNISIDESLTLWKGRLSFKQYIPLKAAKFGIKTFELCESATGYLWSLIVYTGKESATTSITTLKYDNKTSEIVMQLVSPLLNKGHTLWMDNYYNSPTLAATLKNHRTDCVGTLRLNRKNVPKYVKDKKLKRGEHVAQCSGSVSLIKWMDKKPVTMISTYHKNDFKTVKTKSKGDVQKPVCVIDYNKSMGGVDLKDQYLQTYLMERKKTKKWNIKMFKRLLNVTVLNSLIIWKANNPNSKIDTLKFRVDLVEKLFLEHSTERKKGQIPLQNNVERLTGRHFIEKIPPVGNKARPQKRCVVCQSKGKRREPCYWCPDCKVGLCVENCFKEYHTKENY